MNAVLVDEIVLDGCGGPGGWAEGMRKLGLPDVGIEWDAAACLTRRAAGHHVIRADVSQFAVEQLTGKVQGMAWSPPCTTFSAAGDRAGVAILELLGQGIRDMFAGKDTRHILRRDMARELHAAKWIPLVKQGRAKKIVAAVRSAALVIEPARYITACMPEWIVMEQVPSVLPLWQVYAEELRKLGYHTWVGKLNAADYGVPQTRERAILIASRTRKVYRPEPTHYDPRKGMQLWGTPWVSMAEALGYWATERPAPTVTAGGTTQGGYEPFAKGGREALAREQEAGRWVLRKDGQANTAVRPAPAPAPTISFGHAASSMRWELHTNRGQADDGSRQVRDPRSAPAPALTSKSGGQWMLHRSRGEGMLDREGRGGRRDHPIDEPAPTITGAGGKPGGNLTWKFRNNNNNNACERSLDEPAGTLFFSNRSNWAAWVAERPSTTLQGDARVFPPHAGSKGEHQSTDSVRITVQEAAVLQSFPPDYPWQGTKTAQFRQVGDAVPPLLAMHVVAMATGIKISEREAA